MAIHDHAHLGGRPSRTLDVGGKQINLLIYMCIELNFSVFLFFVEFRSVSIHLMVPSRPVGFVNGLWCCMGRGTRLTSASQPVISIPNWLLWRKPTRNARRLASRWWRNDSKHHFNFTTKPTPKRQKISQQPGTILALYFHTICVSYLFFMNPSSTLSFPFQFTEFRIVISFITHGIWRPITHVTTKC